ncbi:MAG: acetyl-CoA carboxylase biotin carboxyl carrier protein subunit [Rhodospirillaceae bacterium]|jgi:biotin carboxyl carrier protein|nr:acetyl-CoA carboxylase biotin carboxyl carrier protein subunit [Rhodospirillaceae bacterium]MBT5516272.1 acetyl-CoA carboxylase biotin carboxyl carrier protein subunit [Rhodospirillaceae bacterium]MBT6087937.1 acetyl-CoA carboxylase biotin carboxyl carrier protein subunit [Rhodospirillaceae bacterium]MBT7248313.1 acetyl-CoA carboxylase biotin carboxyl carrier protein subunit [Rhodospirillaceae bacterium]
MATTEVTSEIIGSVWKIVKSQGDSVAEGEEIMILESMKMEIPVEAPVAGTLMEIKVAPEDSVEEDQVLCLIES